MSERWQERNAKTAAMQYLVRYFGLGHLELVLHDIKTDRKALGRGRD